MSNCAVCREPADTRCSGCLSVYYCSRAHQKEHWKVHKESCKAFELSDDPKVWKDCVAKRNLKTGTKLFTEGAVLVTNYPIKWSDTNHPCLTCSRSPANNVCPVCDWPVCNSDCAEKEMHRANECQIFRENKIHHPVSREVRGLTGEFLMLIRAMALKRTSPELYERLLKLYADPDNRSDEIGVNAFLMKPMIEFLEKKVGWQNLGVTKEEFLKLYRITKLNSQDRIHEDSPVYLRLVYLNVCRMNHCCIPNCVVEVNNQVNPCPDYPFNIRLLRDVKKGEQLTIHNVDPFDVILKRQCILQSRSGIICKCERCLDPTEMGTFLSAVPCQSCRSGNHGLDPNVGYFLTRNTHDIDDASRWECNRCGRTKRASEIEKIQTDAKNLLEQKRLAAIHGGMSRGSLYIAYLKSVEEHTNNRVHPNYLAACCDPSTRVTQAILNSPIDGMETKLHILELMEKRLRHRLTLLEQLLPGLPRHHLKGDAINSLAHVLKWQYSLGKRDVDIQAAQNMIVQMRKWQEEAQ